MSTKKYFKKNSAADDDDDDLPIHCIFVTNGRTLVDTDPVRGLGN